MNSAARSRTGGRGGLRVRFEGEKRWERTQRPLSAPFAETLSIGLAIRIEEFLTALLPRSLEFGRGDVPVRSAFRADGTQVLTEIFHSGPTDEPIAVVDLINDKSGLEDNHVGIAVKDVDATVAYYTKVMGYRVAFKFPSPDGKPTTTKPRSRYLR